MTDGPQDHQPDTVPHAATPAGDVRARWAWAAPEVWTERMLMALDQGVRGGRWHTLRDKVSAERTLRAAFARVQANRGAPGVDQVTVAIFGHSLVVIIANVNRTLRGWFEYFKHSDGSFRTLDTWIRMRLRSILCKRTGWRRYQRSVGTQRWPPAFFAAPGLFSLRDAHAAVHQSAQR